MRLLSIKSYSASPVAARRATNQPSIVAGVRVSERANQPRILLYCAGGLEHAGGIGRVLDNLLRAQQAAGRPWHIHLLDTRGPYSLAVAPLFLLGALTRTVGHWARWRGGRRHYGLLAHVNIAHKGSTMRKLVVCRVLARLGIPYVLHMHANNYDAYFRAQPARMRRVICRAFGAAARVVVLGQFWRDLVIADLGVPAERVTIVRNGAADPLAGTSTAPRRWPGAEAFAAPMILFLGDLRPWKGLGELLEALGSPPWRARRWSLVAAGRGNPAAYQARAAALGIAERVSFPGWLARDAVQALLRRASVVALPSHLEGLSVTLVEALAHGLPVVATPVGAHADLLRDGDNAVVVPPADVAALSAGLARLFDNPALAERIGQGGRQLFQAELEIGQIETQFAAIYQDILDRAGAPLVAGYGMSKPVKRVRHLTG